MLYRLSVRCQEEKEANLSLSRLDPALNTASAASTARTDHDADDSSSAPSTCRSNHNVAKPKKEYKGSTIKPAFNIYDRYFDGNMFTDVLKQCPEMLDAFKEQYEARLVQCYGNVSDVEEGGGLLPEAEKKDFSWILSKKKT